MKLELYVYKTGKRLLQPYSLTMHGAEYKHENWIIMAIVKKLSLVKNQTVLKKVLIST